MSKYWPDGEVAVYSTYYEYCQIGMCSGQFVYRWLHSASNKHVDFQLADEDAIERSPELWFYIQKYQAGDYEHGLRMLEREVGRLGTLSEPVRIETSIQRVGRGEPVLIPALIVVVFTIVVVVSIWLK